MMKKQNNTPTPAEAAGRVLRKDGEKDFNGLKLWYNRIKPSFDTLGRAFNNGLDEVYNEERPFNLDRLKGLFDGSIWKDIDQKIEATIQGKDKALKAHYIEHYAGKKEEVARAFDAFRNAYSDTIYYKSYDGDSYVPSRFTTLDALPIVGDQFIIDDEKINAMRPDFDQYSEDPLHVEMAGLCDELAGVYNRMIENIRRRDPNHWLRREYGHSSEYLSLLPMQYFLKKQPDGLHVEAKYNFIF